MLGDAVTVSMVRDRASGTALGYARVSCTSHATAAAILADCNNTPLPLISSAHHNDFTLHYKLRWWPKNKESISQDHNAYVGELSSDTTELALHVRSFSFLFMTLFVINIDVFRSPLPFSEGSKNYQ